MAKSSKKAASSKKVTKKPFKKSAAGKKNASAKKAVSAKKSVTKKSVTKKSVAKKSVAKKSQPKKQQVTKATVAKKGAKKAAVKSKLVKAPKIRVEKIKAKEVRKEVPSTAALNEQTAKGNDYGEMIKGNSEMPDQRITNNDERGDEMVTMPRSIPAPEEKYGRPADPYHGNTAPVKGKRSIAPSGKKPLWNK